MTLTSARGPLGPDRAGRFSPAIPEGVVYIEPHPRRIQAVRGEETVLDTENVQMVHRVGHPPSYLFRPDDVGALPADPEPEAPGWVRVPWDAADAWFEEGRRLVHYPPNPYHRVDCRPTTRRLRVEVAGTVLVDTDDTTILFETSLEPVLYVDPAHVRTDLLRRSGTTTYCNYKGHSTYWSAVVDDVLVDDVAWSYEDTLPESTPIRGWLSFDAARAEVTADLPTVGY